MLKHSKVKYDVANQLHTHSHRKRKYNQANVANVKVVNPGEGCIAI